MSPQFESPFIRRKFKGKMITFDVTLSGRVLGKIPPLNALPSIMSHFRTNHVRTVLDFGAGRLRNTWPFLHDKDFEVYICEFEQLIPPNDKDLERARNMGLKTLIYPVELLRATIEFDAILLSYVLSILPDMKSRKEVLQACFQKSHRGSYLVVASPNYNTNVRNSCSPSDEYDVGWVRYADKRYEHKAFYSEPTKEQILKLVEPIGFKYEDDWPQRTAKVLRFRKL
jgi:hypothetical protein